MHKRSLGSIVAAAFLALLPATPSALGAAGGLDASFGSGGRVRLALPTYDILRSAKATSDGTVVMLRTGLDSFPDVVRLNPDGSRDLGFGDDGIVRLGSILSTADDVAIDANGDVAVVGSAPQGSFVVRLKPDGALDTDFSGDGAAEIDFGSNGHVTSVLFDGSNIVAAGSDGSNFMAARLLPNGNPDTSFDSDGKASVDFGGRTDTVQAAALGPSGELVLAGGTQTAGGETDVGVAELNSIGQPVQSFGTNGTTIAGFGGANSNAHAVTVDSSGRVIVAGVSNTGGVGVARILSTGYYDTSFATTGYETFDVGGSNYANSVAVTSAGKIVLAVDGPGRRPVVMQLLSGGSRDTSFGSTSNGAVVSFGDSPGFGALAFPVTDGKVLVVTGNARTVPSLYVANLLSVRLGADGALDTSYGQGGGRLVDVGGASIARDTAIQQDGKILIVGSVNYASCSLVRLNRDGSLDRSFAVQGVYADYGLGMSCRAVAIQKDGKIVLAGGWSGDFQVRRLTSDGAPDPTFHNTPGQNSRQINLGGSDVAIALAIQSDGKIVLAGDSYNVNDNGGLDVAVARLNPDGTLDSSFGGGKFTFDRGGYDQVYDLKLQADRILIGGVSEIYNTSTHVYDYRVFLTRRTESGQSDPDFGAGGLKTFMAQEPTLGGLAIAPNGKVLVAFQGLTDTVVHRLTADGLNDPSFGNSGAATVDLGGTNEQGSQLLVEPNGKPVLGGDGSYDGQRDLVGARLTPGGSPDPSFGTGGKSSFDAGASEFGAALSRQTDGKLILTGDSQQSFALDDIVVFRLLGDPPPVVSGLGITPQRFRVGQSATISFGLSEPARVTLSFGRQFAGRRKDGVCVKPADAPPSAPACTGYAPVGTLTMNGAKGSNHLVFKGRIAGNPLSPGTYRVVVDATDANGLTNRTPPSVTFVILR
jgi:uncharacterized delta-60 repeat protein